MEYLNEENFKDLDTFIKNCEDKHAAIGDVNAVVAAIDAVEEIPVSRTVIHVGQLSGETELTLEYFDLMKAQGIVLNQDEQDVYDGLVSGGVSSTGECCTTELNFEKIVKK